MIKSLLFDMNGVIINSEDLNYSVWNKVFMQRGKHLSRKEYDLCIDGKTAAEVASDLCKSDESSKILEHRDSLWFEAFQIYDDLLFPDAFLFLREAKLHGLSCALVSSSRKSRFIAEKLEILDLFDCIVDCGEVSRGKPDPQVINIALDALGVQPHEAILFEDSLVGLAAGKAAGVNCIAIRCKYADMEGFWCRSYSSFTAINLNDLLECFGR